MSCKAPIYRIPTDSSNFRLLDLADRQRVKNGGVLFFDRDFPNSIYSRVPGFDMDDVQKLPCGQCIACRLNYSRDWAVRCSLEAERHEFNYFVTLTYDDDHIPREECIDYSGEIFETQLRRRDVQLFLKKLREWERTERCNTGIKVFYCGEYGSQTSRPHYHLCLFGVSEIPDLKQSFKRGSFQYFKSVLYESFWSEKKNGINLLRGFVDISEVSFDSIAYTARYCLKKQQGVLKKDFLEFYERITDPDKPALRVQPFVGMSLKPGIASEYWHENREQIKLEDKVKYHKAFKLYCSKPPRYFDKLFDREDPKAFKQRKKLRKVAGIEAAKLKRKFYSESDIARADRECAILEMKEDKYHVRNL